LKTEFTYTLLADGTSDRALIPIIDWTIIAVTGGKFLPSGKAVDPGRVKTDASSLASRIRLAKELLPTDLLFVHRDAESSLPSLRKSQIAEAASEAALETAEYLSVIPVRMTEAWLLSDESAIRRAAGNPNGSQQLALPATKKCGNLPDPKSVLFEALRTASGRKGRRLKKFSVFTARALVTSYTKSFEDLNQLSSFRDFKSEVDSFFSARSTD